MKRLLLLVVLSLWATQAHAIGFVQRKDNIAAAPNNAVASVTLDSGVTSSSFVIASIFFCDNVGCSVATTGITSSITLTGCSFSQAVRGDDQTNRSSIIFVAHNCSSGGTSVTSTLTGSSDPHYHILRVSEWSGAKVSSAVNLTAEEYTDNGDPTTIALGTTTEDNQLLYAIAEDVVVAPGSGFTALSNDQEIYSLTNTTGSQTVSWDVVAPFPYLKVAIAVLNAEAGGGGGDASRMRFRQ